MNNKSEIAPLSGIPGQHPTVQPWGVEGRRPELPVHWEEKECNFRQGCQVLELLQFCGYRKFMSF